MENIKVSLRLRPFNERESKSGEKSAWEVSDNNAIQAINENISNPQSRTILQNALSFNKQLRFMYDRCFDESASNKFIYENCVQSILKSSLNGVNGTIFMYGQSGSGKTYTMMGYEKKAFQSSSSSGVPQSLQNSQQSSYSQQTQRKRSFGGGTQSPLSKNASTHAGQYNYEIDDIDFDRIKSNTPQDNQGILILALQDFFDTIRVDEDKTYVVRCSYVEIYNDMIYDLLNPVNKLNEVLQVGMNANKEFYIKGVTQESVSTLDEAYDVLRKGENNKHYAQTTMNHHSSRSHSIFKLSNASSSVSAAQKNVNNQELLQKLNEHDATLVSTSELNFIDLAGSERISNHANLEDILLNESGRTPSNGSRDVSPSDQIKDRVKEGQYINKSLFFLTQVISQIAEGKPLSHIPYRNSPLTKILKSSLGGNARTNIILCITPAQSQFEQSYSTIRFGLNAKKIENKVRVNIQAKNSEEAMQLLILDYEKKIRDLEQQKIEERTRNRELLKKLHDMTNVNNQLQSKLNDSSRRISELAKISSAQPASARSENQVISTTNNHNKSRQETDKSSFATIGQQSSALIVTSRKQVPSGNSARIIDNTQGAHPIRNIPTLKQREIMCNERSLHSDAVGVLFASAKHNLTVDDVCPPLRRDFQDLIFDYEGRYAFHQYRVRNRQLLQYLSLWDKVDANIEEVIKYCIEIYRNANCSSAVATEVKSLSRINLSTFTDAELLSLEKSLHSSVESTIQERYKRKLVFNNGLSLLPLELNRNYIELVLPNSILESLGSVSKQKHQQQQQQLSDESIRTRIQQLFYAGVDVKQLLNKDIDLSEIDFKHLKCIATSDLYSQYNILESEKEHVKRTKRPLSNNATQQNSKSVTPRKKQKPTHEIEEEMERKGYSGFADSLLNHSQSMEERLRYHQKPIPKEQEDEIQSNYEKLQNQSFFEGYSMLSNAHAMVLQPQSNTSLNQQVTGTSIKFPVLANNNNPTSSLTEQFSHSQTKIPPSKSTSIVTSEIASFASAPPTVINYSKQSSLNPQITPVYVTPQPISTFTFTNYSSIQPESYQSTSPLPNINQTSTVSRPPMHDLLNILGSQVTPIHPGTTPDLSQIQSKPFRQSASANCSRSISPLNYSLPPCLDSSHLPFRKDSSDAEWHSDISESNEPRPNSSSIYGMNSFENSRRTSINYPNFLQQSSTTANAVAFTTVGTGAVAANSSQKSIPQLNFNRLDVNPISHSNYNSNTTTPPNSSQPQQYQYPFSFIANTNQLYGSRPTTIPSYKTLDNPMNSFSKAAPLASPFDLDSSQSSKQTPKEMPFSETKHGNSQPVQLTLNSSFSSQTVPIVAQVDEQSTAAPLHLSYQPTMKSQNYNPGLNASSNGNTPKGTSQQVLMPKKRSIQLSNTISIDIIQAPGSSMFTNKIKSNNSGTGVTSATTCTTQPATQNNSSNLSMSNINLQKINSSSNSSMASSKQLTLESNHLPPQRHHRVQSSNVSLPSDSLVSVQQQQQQQQPLRHLTPQPISSKSNKKIYSVDPTGLLNFESALPKQHQQQPQNENIAINQILRGATAQQTSQLSLKQINK